MMGRGPRGRAPPERNVRRPSWYERLLDRDNPAAPIVFVILLVLVIGAVCTFAPILERAIEGRSPESSAPASPGPGLVLVAAGGSASAGYRHGTQVG